MDSGCHAGSAMTSPNVGRTRRYDRKALLLVGMGRSGTSLIAHLLCTLGAAVPEERRGIARGRPPAHRAAVFAVTSDEVASVVDRRRDATGPIDPAWFHSREAHDVVERMVARIDRDYGTARLLLLQDARICRILPLYLAVFDRLNIEPLVILQVRPLSEIVGSLADRNGSTQTAEQFRWLRAVIDAERETRGCTRVWVTLGQVIADWCGTADRIATGLGVRWARDDGEAAHDSARFLKPCHGHAGPASAVSSCAVASAALSSTVRVSAEPAFAAVASHAPMGAAQGLASRVWHAVEYGLAGDEPAARAGFDALRPAAQEWHRRHAASLARLEQRHAPAPSGIHATRSWRPITPPRAHARPPE